MRGRGSSHSVVGVSFQQLMKLTFRAPRPFTAGVHGPAAFGTSFSYPYPSTITGTLSSIAYNKGYCRGLPVSTRGGFEVEYNDHRVCIEELLNNLLSSSNRIVGGNGTRFTVRAGYLSRRVGSGTVFYPYIGSSVFPEVTVLVETFRSRWTNNKNRMAADIAEAYNYLLTTLNKKGREDCLKEEARTVAYKSAFKGIALQRGRKTAVEGMLYSLESVKYCPPASIDAVIISDSLQGGGLTEILRLGKRGIARLEIKPLKSRTGYPPLDVIEDKFNPDKSDYLLILTTPALIDDPECLVVNGVVEIDDHTPFSTWLAWNLLQKYYENNATVIYIPKSGGLFEHSFGTVFSGWNTPQQRPRMPRLLVPPGTVVYVKNVGWERIREMAIKGLGLESDLGWGSFVPVPIG